MSRESSAVAFMEGLCLDKINTILNTGDIMDSVPDRRKKTGILSERDEKIKAYYNEGMNVTQLGKMFNISTSLMTRKVASLGCVSAKTLQERRDAVLVQMHQFGRYKACKIARILGIAPSTVGHALRRQGIKYNRNKKKKV